MKSVILAGGFGSRLSEETDTRPKPMVEIGGRPILWHIMQLYGRHGISEFVICAGYKAEHIKRYFAEYYLVNSDISVNLSTGDVQYVNRTQENWKVTIIDTGINTMTGGRLKRVRSLLQDGTFCLTYGDGLANVDITKSIEYHRAHGRFGTVTAVPSPGRFGIIDLDDGGRVARFLEKPDNEMGYINGGFFVLEPRVLDYIGNDQTIWERDPLERLAQDDQLRAFRHTGFWKAMDTLRDKREFEALWESGAQPWRN